MGSMVSEKPVVVSSMRESLGRYTTYLAPTFFLSSVYMK